MYPWIVLLHIVGSFLFVVSHGASIWVVNRIARENDVRRIAALSDLSSTSLAGAYLGLLLLGVGGIWAGVTGDWFRFGWAWVSIAVFLGVAIGMYVVAVPFFKKLRVALGQRVQGMAKDAPDPVPAAEQDTLAIAAAAPAMLLNVIGFGGLLVVLWLMVVKPF